MFPDDAITEYFELTVPATLIVEGPGEYTILNVSLLQSNNNSPLRVECGPNVVAKSYMAGFSSTPMSYNCENENIEIIKTGNNNATAVITYVPYLTDYATSTYPGYNPTTEIASSSDVQIYGSISAGELIIAVLLMMFLLLKLFELLANSLSKLQVNRKFLRYGGGDVPIDTE